MPAGSGRIGRHDRSGTGLRASTEGARLLNVLPSSKVSAPAAQPLLAAGGLASSCWPSGSPSGRSRASSTASTRPCLSSPWPSSFLDVDDGANGPSGELKVQEVGEEELQPNGFRVTSAPSKCSCGAVRRSPIQAARPDGPSSANAYRAPSAVPKPRPFPLGHLRKTSEQSPVVHCVSRSRVPGHRSEESDLAASPQREPPRTE